MAGICRRFFATKTALENKSLAKIRVKNENVLQYKPGSTERKDLEEALSRMSLESPEIPIVIGKNHLLSTCKIDQNMPHRHKEVIAKFCYASKAQIHQAINEAVKCQEMWRRVDIEKKYEIWNNAAELFAGKYRQKLNAAIMLGQAKTVIQAEIDTVELIDFLRFGAEYLIEISKTAPLSPNPNKFLNSFHLRPLDGFVAAITPFNFTAIGGNLAFTPALLGNCIVWKPTETAMLSNWIVYKVMMKAGLPPGVVNFVPADPNDFGDVVTSSPHLGGVNFTGSVGTFRKLWAMIAKNIGRYGCFPRMVGECGGKNYHFLHPTADLNTVVPTTIRAAFEYSGQKCSACSRLYCPDSLWVTLSAELKKATQALKIGDVCDFSVFTSAVIDDNAFNRIAGYLKSIGTNSSLETIAGGRHSKIDGYFITPTIVRTDDPCDSFMTEEIFGPVLTVYVYHDADLYKALNLVNRSTQYALTGAIYAQDKEFISQAVEHLRMSAGNFYINDKCTGSVVAQQPFGGSRLSGTNDKAGSPQFLLRWASPQIIKQTFVPLPDVNYPYMEA